MDKREDRWGGAGGCREDQDSGAMDRGSGRLHDAAELLYDALDGRPVWKSTIELSWTSTSSSRC